MTAVPAPNPEALKRMERLDAMPLNRVSSARGLSFATEMRRVWNYRELLDLLIRRELKVRYKDSSLGFLWTLIRPLAMLLVYWVAVGKFLGAAREIDDFAIYLFTGLTLWQLISEILATSTASVLANQGLVKKVDLPLEVFPLASVGSALFNFAIQSSVLVLATAVLTTFPTGVRWLYLPLALGVALVWAVGIGFVLAAINVFLRDVQYLVEIFLMIWFWVCPIAYSWKLLITNAPSQALQEIYLLNPFGVAVMGFQRVFWVAGDGEPFPAHLGTRLVIMLAVGLVVAFCGQRVFQRMSGNFAQEL